MQFFSNQICPAARARPAAHSTHGHAKHTRTLSVVDASLLENFRWRPAGPVGQLSASAISCPFSRSSSANRSAQHVRETTSSTLAHGETSVMNIYEKCVQHSRKSPFCWSKLGMRQQRLSSSGVSKSMHISDSGEKNFDEIFSHIRSIRRRALLGLVRPHQEVAPHTPLS